MKIKNKIIVLLLICIPVGVFLYILFVPKLFMGIKIERAKIQYTKRELLKIENALNLYFKDHGQYPSSEEGLKIIKEKLYYKGPLIDAWGNPYIFRFPSENMNLEFDLWSNGPPKGDNIISTKNITSCFTRIVAPLALRHSR